MCYDKLSYVEVKIMAITETISVYMVLEKLIRYFEKKNVDVKIIEYLKECKNLDFMRE